MIRFGRKNWVVTSLATISFCVATQGQADRGVARIDAAHLSAIGKVSDRYQSYNIEMIQVMGGKWWAPYDKPLAAPAPGQSSGLAGAPMLYRAPTNLADPRLRKLAVALSPTYVRVTDTWANTVYFQDSDTAQPVPPPPGFRAVLTSQQWKGVIDYSNALDAQIVTSFSIGTGVRDAAGVWTPVEAKKFLAYTKKAGGSIAAAEFFNEPNLGVVSGAPKGYNALAYARDYKIFDAFVRSTDPAIQLLGPGPVGEEKPLPKLPPQIRSEDILRNIGSVLDGVSYHFYGAVSQRCGAFGPSFLTTPAKALSPEWLNATDKVAAVYRGLRDRFEPGKPVWLTETAEAACGGDPWAASFIDSFRYLNQLGSLAKQGVYVVMHNTLAGSDYGLIDDRTLTPRPNYWAAVLWRRLMGTTVLESGQPAAANLYLYAQCLRGHAGGVAILAINADRSADQEIAIPAASERYTLTAKDLLGTDVALNGKILKAAPDGSLPAIAGERVRPGSSRLAPASITFFAVPDAANTACR